MKLESGAAVAYIEGERQNTDNQLMSIKDTFSHLIERTGFYLGYIIGFLIIMMIGIVALWVTMEPYH